MVTMKEIATSPFLTILIGFGLVYIVAFSLVYLLKASKRAREMGITNKEIREVVNSSLVFSLVPSLSIVIGLAALAAAVGATWAWWRLSVIGSLSYETQISASLAPALGFDSIGQMMSQASGQDFGVIMILMTMGMLSGFFVLLPFGKKLCTSVDKTKKGNGWSEVLSGTFILVLLAVYVPIILIGDTIQALVMIVGLIVAVFLGILAKKPGLKWLNNFIMAISMIVAMVSSLLWTAIF